MDSRKILAKAIENWPAKVLSVAAALGLFVFHRMSTLDTRAFTTPIKIEASSELVPTTTFSNFARISIRGDSGSINYVLEDDIEAYIDLNKFTQEGWNRIPVQIRKKGSALGIEPLEITIDPIEVSIMLEHKVMRNISVYPVLHGSVASGYEMISGSLSTPVITVEGPYSAIESLESLQTETVNLDGRSGDFAVSVRVINTNPLVVILGNGSVEYRGVIRHITIEEPDTEQEPDIVQEEETGND